MTELSPYRPPSYRPGEWRPGEALAWGFCAGLGAMLAVVLVAVALCVVSWATHDGQWPRAVIILPLGGPPAAAAPSEAPAEQPTPPKRPPRAPFDVN